MGNSGLQQKPLSKRFGLVISNPSYRRLWGIGLLSRTMHWLETVALGIFVFELTGSPFWVGVVGFLRLVPMFIFGPVVGLIADRMNRKILMGSSMAMLACVYAVMGLLVVTGDIELWHVCIGATVAGVVGSTDYVVRRAMIGDVVGSDEISTAIGIDMATSNFSRVIGPLGAGAFLATIGVQAAYFSGAVLFGIGAVVAFSMPYVVAPLKSTDGPSGYFVNLSAGLKHVRADRIIFVTIIITMVMNLFGFPYQHMVPVIGSETLKVGPLFVGILLSSEGLGATMGSLMIALKARPAGYTRVYSIGSIGFLTAIIIFSLSPSFWMALPVMLISGFSMSGFATMQSIIVITSAPIEIRGRVLGVLATAIGTGPFGALIVGSLAVTWGANNAVTAIALTGLVLTTLTLMVWPEFLRNLKNSD